MRLQLQKIENWIDAYKDKLWFIPPIAIVIGVVIQLYNLTVLNAVSFFSWTQVINEAINMAGIMFVYTSILVLFTNITSTEKMKIYIRIAVIVIIIPWVIRNLLVGFDVFDTYTTSLERSFTFYIFLLYSIIWIKYLRDIYTDVFFQERSLIHKFIVWKRRIIYRIMVTIWYGLLLVVTYFSWYDYFSWSHAVLFNYRDKIYLSNYFNDKFIFTMTEEKRLLVVPTSEVKWMINPMMAVGLLEGIKILLPDDKIIRHIAPVSTPVEKNWIYRFVTMEEVTQDN